MPHLGPWPGQLVGMNRPSPRALGQQQPAQLGQALQPGGLQELLCLHQRHIRKAACTPPGGAGATSTRGSWPADWGAVWPQSMLRVCRQAAVGNCERCGIPGQRASRQTRPCSSARAGHTCVSGVAPQVSQHLLGSGYYHRGSALQSASLQRRVLSATAALSHGGSCHIPAAADALVAGAPTCWSKLLVSSRDTGCSCAICCMGLQTAVTRCACALHSCCGFYGLSAYTHAACCHASC